MYPPAKRKAADLVIFKGLLLFCCHASLLLNIFGY